MASFDPLRWVLSCHPLLLLWQSRYLGQGHIAIGAKHAEDNVSDEETKTQVGLNPAMGLW